MNLRRQALYLSTMLVRQVITRAFRTPAHEYNLCTITEFRLQESSFFATTSFLYRQTSMGNNQYISK